MTIEQWNLQIQDIHNTKIITNAEQLIADYMEVKSLHGNEKCIFTENVVTFVRILKHCMEEIAKKDKNGGIEEIDLSYEDFSKQDFSFSGIKDSDVNEMVFYNGKFKGTDFSGANLDAISFYMCDLSDAIFAKAFMECSYFGVCNMIRCNMDGAHLMASVIEECNWADASVRGTNLLEITAKKVTVAGLHMDERTAVNDADFDEFDWSSINVSGLSISVNQVKYFNECANGGNKIEVYDPKFIKLEKGSRDVENAILDSILEQYTAWNSTDGEEIEVFISYACPNEKDLACQIYEQIREADKSVWMDIMLEKEKKLNEQLEYVLRSCKEAIILLSETYKEKAWTRYEIIRLCEESKKRNLNITIYNFLDEKVDLCNVLNDEKHITGFTNAKVINMFER